MVSIKGTSMQKDHQVAGGDMSPYNHHVRVVTRRDEEGGGVGEQHSGCRPTGRSAILEQSTPMEYWRPRLICGGTPFGVESHIIAMEAGRASCVDKLPGPGERKRIHTLGEGDSLVTVEHVIELPRGGGRGTRWARQRRATMDVARLVRSRHGVQVVLRRGLTDVGDVGADGLGQEAITKRWGVGPERCEQSEHVRRQHSTKDVTKKTTDHN